MPEGVICGFREELSPDLLRLESRNCEILDLEHELFAFLLLALGLVERIANATGYTILRVRNWERLLDIAVALFVFVIAEQLREIRGQLTKGRA